MSYYKNLVPGQMQLGDIVMGYGTNIKLESVEINADDIDAQDYQVPKTSEKRFGQDNFKPSTIELKMQLLNDRLLPDWESSKPNFWHSMPTINDLKNEWRFDEGRQVWGQMKPLYICSKLDGIPKIVFGRPGQFKYKFDDEYNHGEVIEIMADYRRADTLAYSAVEFVTEVDLGEAPTTIVRSGGDADTWLRIVGYGPISNPVINIGSEQIKLDIEIDDDEAFEISSYPWQRRVINSDRLNLSANLSGDTRYLDKLILPAKTFTFIRWTSDEMNMFVPNINNVSWQEDIDDMRQSTLPDAFTVLRGRVYVRRDIFNPDPLSRFLGAATFASQLSACVYNKSTFKTYNQQATAKLTELKAGRSGIAIMSTPTMSNYAMVEVTNSAGNHWLKIRTGSTPYTFSSVRASWENLAFGGFKETDEVSIRSEYNVSTHHVTYKALLNGVEKCSWTDSSDVVASGGSNRSAGYIFNMDDGVFSVGPGFRDLVCYDHGTVPAPTGRLFFMWRDAFTVI